MAATEEKQMSKADKKAARMAARERAQRNIVVINHPDEAQFGDLIRNQSTFKTNRVWLPFPTLSSAHVGQRVWIRARVHAVRGKGKTAFLLLRYSFAKGQAVLFASESTPKEMVKYAQKIQPESLIDVYGLVTAPANPVESATGALRGVEIRVERLYVISRVEASELPFQLDDAERSEAEIAANPEAQYVNVGQEIRLNNRWIDLRTTANQAIFRIQAGVGRLFRQYLTSQGFVEVHTPKLLPGASEGGSDVFKTDYFGRQACLAQSPQLYKQMTAVGCDLHRVFEIGPVFRAENSNTHRHLCEFTGLDFEFEINEHYHEVLQLVGELFKFIFKGLSREYASELEAVRRQYPFEDLMFRDELLILTFKEAMDMLHAEHARLIAAGEQDEADKLMLGQSKDFSTPAEKCLGRLVKDKFQTEFYCVDKYPLSARPFYTMPCPFDPTLSNSYDFFVRGEEIMSGAQRVHEAGLLVERAEALGVPVHTIQAYVDSFKYASSPHGGGGIGLERVCMLFLNLDNVRKVSMFPRDPHRCEP